MLICSLFFGYYSFFLALYFCLFLRFNWKEEEEEEEEKLEEEEEEEEEEEVVVVVERITSALITVHL